MKKCLLLVLALIMMVQLVPVYASAAEPSLEIGGVDVLPKTDQVTLLTPAYSKPDTGMSGSNIMEIVVSADTITSVDTVGSTIPEDGYVLVIRGGELIKKVKESNPKTGDRIMVSSDLKSFAVLNDSYDPFYEVTISFNAFNSTRTENTIIIYDSGKTSGTNVWGNEVVVNADGVVASIGGNDNAVPEGGYVISAVGNRIAELNNAAKLGMTVTVDKTAKTITFEYGKQSVINGMNSAFGEFEAKVNAARERFAVLEYSDCYDYLSSLEERIINAEAALKSDSLAEAMLAKRDFEVILKEAESALIEYPAVESRTLWIRPHGSENREKVNAVVKGIHEMGFNTICIELLYDSTTIFPIDTAKYGFSQNPSLNGFDVLEAYIDECHKYGIEVQGWMTVYRVGYETSTYASLSLASVHEDWRCISASGKNYVYNEYGNGWFLNPALPEVSECLLNFYGYIFDNYDLDAFQLDYIRYPYSEGEMFGYDDYTLSLFEEKYKKNPRDLKSGDALWHTWCEFRAAFVTDFVKKVRDLMEEKRPDMYLSAAVAPNFNEVYTKYMQEAEKWLKEGIVDIEFPMAYGTNVIPLYSSYTVAAAGDDGYAYIGVGDYGADVFMRQIEEVRESGADGVAFFAYAQYTEGDYAKKLTSAHFAKLAVSPTYDASKAVAAQLEYILERAYAISTVDDKALPISVIDLLFDNISAVLYDDNLDEMKATVDKLIFDLEKAECDQQAKEALLKDLKKAQKFAALSRDEAKDKYHESHPLPDPYEEPSQEESGGAGDTSEGSELSENTAVSETSEDISETPKTSNTGIIIGAICGGLAVIAAVVTFVIIRKKKK